jgi:hypothetical protein
MALEKLESFPLAEHPFAPDAVYLSPAVRLLPEVDIPLR